MRIKKCFPFADRAYDARAENAAVLGAVPARAPLAPVYQFTIVSLSATLNTLRKQLYYELQALDLRVLTVRISRAESGQLASTVVTLRCPPHLRNPLNAVALRLGQSPDVRRVHWESDAGAAIAVLPA